MWKSSHQATKCRLSSSYLQLVLFKLLPKLSASVLARKRSFASKIIPQVTFMKSDVIQIFPHKMTLVISHLWESHQQNATSQTSCTWNAAQNWFFNVFKTFFDFNLTTECTAQEAPTNKQSSFASGVRWEKILFQEWGTSFSANLQLHSTNLEQ